MFAIIATLSVVLSTASVAHSVATDIPAVREYNPTRGRWLNSLAAGFGLV